MKENKYATWAYYIGITIVFLTHFYILGFGMPQSQMIGHAILNLIAGCLLAYSWFKRY